MPKRADRLWKRCFASPADSIHVALQNQLQDVRQIELEINELRTKPVPTLDPETHATVQADSIAEDYYELIRRRTTPESEMKI